MTPAGHASVSYIIGKKKTNLSLPFLMIGGIAPDFDFIFFFLDNFNELHRTFSHSLVSWGAVSLLIYGFTKTSQRTKALSFFVGACMHILIDASLDSNPSNGLGVMMLWPISHEHIYLFDPLGVEINRGSWHDGVSFLKNNFVYILLIELPFWLYAVINFRKIRHGSKV